MRRRLILSLVGVNLVLLGSWVTVWLALPKHRINAESITQIKAGMSKQEVETILGAAPGDYSQGMAGVWLCGRGWQAAEQLAWLGDEAAVRVYFDAEGRVLGVLQGGVMRSNESLRDKLRRWLGL